MEKMTQSSAETVGVDISKDHLDVHIHPTGATNRFTNNGKGHQAFLAWLTPDQVERVVFEATGAYHRVFERTLAAAGLPLAKINPLQARRFAEATGKRAKTDAIDAAMLAKFGALLKPQTREPVSKTLDEMKDLHNAKGALIKDRTATLNRQKEIQLPLLKRLATQRLKQIEGQLKAINAALHALCAADKALQAKFDILVSIPGIGPATAFAILIEMPELGTLEAPQAASLAGLAPVARDSGNWKGKRSIRGGRANLRQAIYMPALVATRFNPDFKAKYQAMIAAGKPAKVAITTIMRKIIVLANALLKAGRNWEIKAA
jgi:transposase